MAAIIGIEDLERLEEAKTEGLLGGSRSMG